MKTILTKEQIEVLRADLTAYHNKKTREIDQMLMTACSKIIEPQRVIYDDETAQLLAEMPDESWFAAWRRMLGDDCSESPKKVFERLRITAFDISMDGVYKKHHLSSRHWHTNRYVMIYDISDVHDDIKILILDGSDIPLTEVKCNIEHQIDDASSELIDGFRESGLEV